MSDAAAAIVEDTDITDEHGVLYHDEVNEKTTENAVELNQCNETTSIASAGSSLSALKRQVFKTMISCKHIIVYLFRRRNMVIDQGHLAQSVLHMKTKSGDFPAKAKFHWQKVFEPMAKSV